MEKLKKESGITLIALVITIIVLLILAGISISMLTGENGILKRAQEAKEKTELATKEEEETLYELEDMINELDTVLLEKGKVAEKTQKNNYTDTDENKATVPKGFAVSKDENEDEVNEGLVIKDTSGNEFVWIPVGTNIKDRNEGMQTVTLGRYVFTEEGKIDTTLSKTNPEGQLKRSLDLDSKYYFTEVKKNDETDNTHAKDIEGFISSVGKYGGYYIGRYEARTSSSRTAKTENDAELPDMTVKADDYVYNCVTQSQAAKKSQEMYNNEEDGFVSDLMNSYAWDTAIDFLQKFDDRSTKTTPYSRQNSLYKNLAAQGTNKLTDSSKQDKICNIWDMASNCYEWSTETYSNPRYPCVYIGGYCSDDNSYASCRVSSYTTAASRVITFRPLLYIM